MVRLRTALTAIAFASALVSRSAVAQQGSSVSLTHTVSVTVPPRVKVQVGSAQVAQTAMHAATQTSTNGLSLSISATQPWALSIGAAAKSKVQWSRDGQSEFSTVTTQQSVVASGKLSQIPAAATVFVRPAASVMSSRDGGSGDSSVVMLTVVAQ